MSIFPIQQKKRSSRSSKNQGMHMTHRNFPFRPHSRIGIRLPSVFGSTINRIIQPSCSNCLIVSSERYAVGIDDGNWSLEIQFVALKTRCFCISKALLNIFCSKMIYGISTHQFSVKINFIQIVK